MGFTSNYIFLNLVNLTVIGLLLYIVAIKVTWIVSIGLLISFSSQYLITKHKDTFNV